MPYFMFPKLGPWYMAQARIAVVHFVTIPLAVSTEFWETWAAVYSASYPSSHARNITIC